MAVIVMTHKVRNSGDQCEFLNMIISAMSYNIYRARCLNQHNIIQYNRTKSVSKLNL